MAQLPHGRVETDLPTRAAGASCAPTDLRAAEALADAMASWDTNELACYREAVAAEVAHRGDVPPDGFLAAELLALAWLDDAHRAVPAGEAA